MKEVAFNNYVLMRTPNIIDQKAMEIGYLQGNEGVGNAMVRNHHINRILVPNNGDRVPLRAWSG
jgi:hypothetical protein